MNLVYKNVYIYTVHDKEATTKESMTFLTRITWCKLHNHNKRTALDRVAWKCRHLCTS